MPSTRQLLTDLFDAAVAGVAPGPVTARAVESLAIPRDRRVWVFAIGKAAPAMAAAAVASLQKSLHNIVGGLVVSPAPSPSPYGTIGTVVGDHPVPGRNSFTAAAQIGQTASGMRGSDTALVLLSGGASSLIGAPLRGLGDTEYTQLCELLLGSGLDITATNVVRKRFSRWGGGRLALALAPAATVCLAISDVVGDDLAAIGSGPCVPDPSTVQDVIEILQRTGLYQRMPASFRDMLAGVSRGVTPETPKRSHPAFAHVTSRVIANNRMAREAAAAAARERGIAVQTFDAPLADAAAVTGEQLARRLLDAAVEPAEGARCMIWGGETTVTLYTPGSLPAPARGTPATPMRGVRLAPPGGRCQELALATARVLAEAGPRAAGITLLAAGTDGRDGTTDAAGAIVDGETWGAIAAAGRDPAAALANHDAHTALDAAGALLRTGATGTNVTDVVIGLVE